MPEHRRMQGRLAIPYITPAGPVAMAFRCIEDHKCSEIPRHSKYLNPPGQVAHLYGVLDCRTDSQDIAVSEGEINAITASELCGIPCLGLAGANKWQRWWGLVFSDFRHVYVLEDGDKGGEGLTKKLTDELGSKVVPVPFPAREDVNSHYLKVGRDEIRRMVGV